MAALEKAKKAQTHSTEAWLASKAGKVQNRPPAASRWQETELQQKLKEREKIRTLAASRCIIEFSDQSEISLDEHALVVIGAMKKNIIRSSYSNDVSMIEGDITVHLASLSAQKKFRAGLPGITTEIRSRHFLTSRDEKNITRIANYDGEIDIKAQGAQVTVKSQAEKKTEAAEPVEQGTLRVLAADDNRGNQMLIRTFLKKFGLAVDIVDNGSEALQKMQETAYDVIFMESTCRSWTGWKRPGNAARMRA